MNTQHYVGVDILVLSGVFLSIIAIGIIFLFFFMWGKVSKVSTYCNEQFNKIDNQFIKIEGLITTANEHTKNLTETVSELNINLQK